MLSYLEVLSQQSPILISSNVKNDKTINNYTQCFKRETFRFNPEIDSEEFYLKNNTFSTFVPSKNQSKEFIVDFMVGKERYQWDVTKNRFELSNKTKKENLDLISLGIHMRLSCAQEETRQADLEEFLELLKNKRLGLVRVKLRNNYDFQFIRFSLTKTYHITTTTITEDFVYLLKDSLKGDLEQQRPDKEVFGLINKNKLDFACEVEAEIIDTKFLVSLLKKNDYQQFRFFIERYFRNFNLIARRWMEFEWKNYEALLKSMSTEKLIYPVIGHYLEEIHADK